MTGPGGFGSSIVTYQCCAACPGIYPGGRGAGNWAPRTRKRSEACGGRPGRGGEWAARPLKRPPTTTSTTPSAATTGPRCCGSDTSRNTGNRGRQNAATRRSAQREERPTVQGPVKKPQPNGISHGGGGVQHMAAQLEVPNPTQPNPGVRDALEGGGGYPPPLQGAQPMPSHCPPDAKCQPQWHSQPTVTALATSSNRLPNRCWGRL